MTMEVEGSCVLRLSECVGVVDVVTWRREPDPGLNASHRHRHRQGPSSSNLMNFQGKTGSQTPAARCKHMDPHSFGPSVW